MKASSGRDVDVEHVAQHWASIGRSVLSTDHNLDDVDDELEVLAKSYIELKPGAATTPTTIDRDTVRKAIDRGLSSWFDTMTATGFEAIDRATDAVMAELRKAGAK